MTRCHQRRQWHSVNTTLTDVNENMHSPATPSLSFTPQVSSSPLMHTTLTVSHKPSLEVLCHHLPIRPQAHMCITLRTFPRPAAPVPPTMLSHQHLVLSLTPRPCARLKQWSKRVGYRKRRNVYRARIQCSTSSRYHYCGASSSG